MTKSEFVRTITEEAEKVGEEEFAGGDVVGFRTQLIRRKGGRFEVDNWGVGLMEEIDGRLKAAAKKEPEPEREHVSPIDVNDAMYDALANMEAIMDRIAHAADKNRRYAG